MKSEYVKKLTGKDPRDFEVAASYIIDNADVEAFSLLVEKSEFLFDFIKANVAKRLSAATNEKNYKNLLSFLSIYSHDYEDFIVSTLVKYADEDMTDEMLEKLEKGSEAEKTYAAKYFSHVQDPLALEELRNCSYCEFEPLSINCAAALSSFKDDFSYEIAIEKLKSVDEFEKLSAVKFLCAYGDLKALDAIFEAMKTSSMPENIVSEIPYMKNFLELLGSKNNNEAILALNHVVNGLGEIISLSQIFDFQLFEVFQKLINLQKVSQDSKVALLLLNARDKFDQLTENDEYIFDEDKNTKNEVFEIKKFLNFQTDEFWAMQEDLFLDELDEKSEFVFSALELTQKLAIEEAEKLKSLLESNQTIILKTLEVMKSLNLLDCIDKDQILARVTDDNIKAIIVSLF